MNLDCESPPPPPTTTTSTERKSGISETNEDAISVQGTSSGDEEQEVNADDLVSAFEETMPAKKGRGRPRKPAAHGLAHGPTAPKKRGTGKGARRGRGGGGGGGHYTKAEMIKIVNQHIASKFRAAGRGGRRGGKK
jgi:hypothetical protein